LCKDLSLNSYQLSAISFGETAGGLAKAVSEIAPNSTLPAEPDG
jgi:hypothetical protein